MPTKVYRSAIDLWLAILLIGAPLAFIFTGASIGLGLHLLQWHAHFGRIAGLCIIGIGIALALLIAALTLPCRYTLTETDLRIQCGLLRWRIPYGEILQLELSCNLWIAPALSLNRVKVVLTQGVRFISPKNRFEFIDDLKNRMEHANPHGHAP